MKIQLTEISFVHGYNCFFASLFNVLRYYGCSLHEADLYLLQKEIFFRYDRSSKGSLPADSFAYQRYDDSSEWLMEQFDLTCDQFSVFDQSAVKKSLINGAPVILMVKSQILTYTKRIFHPSNAREFHCVVLYGIDEETNEALLADCYVVDNKTNISCYTGRFPLQTLKNYTFGGICIHPGFIAGIAEETILMAMQEKLEYFICRDNGGRYAHGKWALLACVEDNLILEKLHHKLIPEFYLELSYLIKAHFLCYYQYIYNTVQRIPRLMIYSAPVWNMRNQWNAYCMKLWKASMDSTILTPAFFMNRAKELFVIQETLFTSICNTIKSNGGTKIE